jgi:hypothetical protein
MSDEYVAYVVTDSAVVNDGARVDLSMPDGTILKTVAIVEEVNLSYRTNFRLATDQESSHPSVVTFQLSMSSL